MAFIPHGTTFSIGGTPVAELTDIGGPSSSVEETEVTSHDSNFHKEFLPGLIEEGEISLEGNLVLSDAGYQALRTAFKTRAVVAWQILYPNEYGWSGDGFFTAFEATSPSDGSQATFSATLRITGEITDIEPS